MRRKEWSRYAAFAAIGMLVGFIVDRTVHRSTAEPAPPQPTIVAASVASEAPPTPLVTIEPAPVLVEPTSPPPKPKARIVAARRTPPPPGVATVARPLGPILDVRQ